MKVVSLLSGGIDSSTMLYYLKYEFGHIPTALTILYGQKHSKELDSAIKVCRHFSVEHKVLDLSILGEVLTSALTSKSIDIPKVPETPEHYETLAQTVVPNRNAIFLSIAAGIAKSLGAGGIAYAAHFSDRGVYPDCRAEFVASLSCTVKLGLGDSRFEVLSPFIHWPKSQIVKWGSLHKFPYELTWSCYEGKDKHCGTCSSCRERQRSFSEAGVVDPTEYVRSDGPHET